MKFEHVILKRRANFGDEFFFARTAFPHQSKAPVFRPVACFHIIGPRLPDRAPSVLMSFPDEARNVRHDRRLFKASGDAPNQGA